MTISILRLRIARALVAAAILVPAAARAQLAVLSSTVEEKTVAAGSRYDATIVISNPGTTPQAAKLYQTDYRFAADGTSDFGEPGSAQRSNAAWITPQTTHIVVPANGQVRVPYTVVVPAGDSLRGTYWSTVMVEGVTNAPTASDRPAMDLGSVMRYAIQIATHIANSGTRAVKFDNPSPVRSAKGTATLDVDVLNTGERGYRPTLSVELYDANGKLCAKAKQSRGLLYPESSLRQHFDLGGLPAGAYKALVFADTGDDRVFGAQYTITF